MTTTRTEPESFRARALSASLTVGDIRKSLAWYRDVVGFTVDQLYERDGTLRSVALKAGDVRILINQDDGAKGRDRVKGAGFSLQFITVQDIDDLAAEIRARGGTLDSEPADMPWGARVFRMLEANGQVVTRSAERLQASAERTSKEIQEALTSYIGRMKDIYARN